MDTAHIADYEIEREVRNLNFVRSALLMAEYGYDHFAIEYMQDLAIKQYIAHGNYSGLKELIQEWNIAADRIAALDKHPLDSTLYFG